MCAVTLAACANGRPGNQNDIDASTNPIADAGPDGPPLSGFGEPCTDNHQCESGLCILVGTSGQCTKTCGDCPDGYGCLGVEGISIEGQVTFVCVPTSSQLCTTCTQDSECTLIGMDKCVTYPDGDRACARDCSTVTCPTGYSCQNVSINNVNYKQCMADSGACDCSAANPGAMQPCNITTPWNVCEGAQTCAGATGWGTCQAPSPNDDPDPTFADTNCDGLDGDRARAIFVSPAGVNTSTCGLDYNDPCQTIQFGISRAVTTSRPHVYVQSGTYSGTVTMANGVSVFGGYNFNWRRRPYSDAGHGVTIAGGVVGVRFNAITQPTWLDDLIVQSANATSSGGSSTGVLVTTSTLVELRGVLVQAGAGGAGTGGSNGGAGAGGGPGGTGAPGCEDSGFLCGSCNRPLGGGAGGSSCGTPGGTGGQPGHGGGGGSPGLDGTQAFFCPGGPGCGGAGASCGGSRACDGQTGFDGLAGDGGSHGTPGANIGAFSSFSYQPANGSAGFSGGSGNGGGGGGGGGGGDDNCDSYGSSGGGGGGGGCGGTRGTGGFGGGGSFGVLAYDSDVVLSGAIVSTASGGVGGRGGTGGNGGGGGSPGPGGGYGGSGEQDDGGDGAYGGWGGSGGRGGDGGGGGGGPSVSLVCLGSSASAVTVVGTTLTPGAGGGGGGSLAPGSTGLSAATYGCN